MCEGCNAAREEMWAEVRDLIAFTDGPLSVAVRARLEEVMSDNSPIIQTLIDLGTGENYKAEVFEAIRCMMISHRLALITTYGNSSKHGRQPSIIIAEWAGEMMERELQAAFLAQNDKSHPLNSEHANMLDIARALVGDLINDGHGI